MELRISPHSDTVVPGSHQSLGNTTKNVARGTILAISMSLAGGVFAQTDAIAKIAQSGVAVAKGGDISILPTNTYSVELPSGSHINKRDVSGNTPLFHTITIDTGNIHGIEINIASWTGLILPDDTSGNKKIEILSDFLGKIINNHPKFKDLQNIHITTPTNSSFPKSISIPEKTITMAHNPAVIDTGMVSISNISLHDQAYISEVFELLRSKNNQSTRNTILIISGVVLLILSGGGGWWLGGKRNRKVGTHSHAVGMNNQPLIKKEHPELRVPIAPHGTKSPSGSSQARTTALNTGQDVGATNKSLGKDITKTIETPIFQKEIPTTCSDAQKLSITTIIGFLLSNGYRENKIGFQIIEEKEEKIVVLFYYYRNIIHELKIKVDGVIYKKEDFAPGITKCHMISLDTLKKFFILNKHP